MGGDGLGERHRLVAERIVAGLTPLETATSLGVAPRTMAATVEDLQRSLGVLTLRALSFRLMAQGLVPLPPPLPQPKLDPMTRHVWAALPWDILDIDLTPVLATAIRVAPDHIRSVIDRLCETHATSRHGLIRAGIAHGVLGVGQGVTPPPTSAVLASPPGPVTGIRHRLSAGCWHCWRRAGTPPPAPARRPPPSAPSPGGRPGARNWPVSPPAGP